MGSVYFLKYIKWCTFKNWWHLRFSEKSLKWKRNSQNGRKLKITPTPLGRFNPLGKISLNCRKKSYICIIAILWSLCGPRVFFIQCGRQTKRTLVVQVFSLKHRLGSPWGVFEFKPKIILKVGGKNEFTQQQQKIHSLHCLNRLEKDFMSHFCWFNLTVSERDVREDMHPWLTFVGSAILEAP